MYRQYDLASGEQRLTCWLNHPRTLWPGTVLTLHGDTRNPPVSWRVVRVGRHVLDAPPDTTYQVGGL